MKPRPPLALDATRIDTDIDIVELASLAPPAFQRHCISEYWTGAAAPEGRHFIAGLLWSDTGLYVRFDANQAEPLVVSDVPDLSKKSIGLWEGDVCEIFVAPNPAEPRRYFEFEIAPTREWLDVAIDSTGGERVTDWNYKSGMESFARIEEARVTMAMKIPWAAFGQAPVSGDVWLGNIFRCVGEGPERGYLAYNPTETELPNFHVPEKFVEFRFSE